MRISALVVMLFLIGLSPAGTEERAAENGYMWEAFESRGKAESSAYQLGIVKGYLLGCSRAQQCCPNEDSLLKSAKEDPKNVALLLLILCEVTKLPELSFRDYIDGINQFYSDYANKNLPIDNAFTYISYRTSGIPEDSLAKYLESWRKKQTK